ncbi:hypothetical protein E4T56_gene4211 [Termitomyces sp. T112]|nr:hypothetical protein E4T56_gene4211 [Termitomyces sp. T112]
MCFSVFSYQLTEAALGSSGDNGFRAWLDSRQWQQAWMINEACRAVNVPRGLLLGLAISKLLMGLHRSLHKQDC